MSLDSQDLQLQSQRDLELSLGSGYIVTWVFVEQQVELAVSLSLTGSPVRAWLDLEPSPSPWPQWVQDLDVTVPSA